MPLHIFEERYRELIGECLADEAEFGLILEDDDGLRQVGTRTGVIELVHTFDDGRMNVLVEGRERFPDRRAETEGRSFRTAEVELLEDDEARSRATRRPRGRSRCSGSSPRSPRPTRSRSPIRGRSTPLSFQLAARVDFGHELKQELLELRSERARLDASPTCSSRRPRRWRASARCASARPGTARSRATRGMTGRRAESATGPRTPSGSRRRSRVPRR